MALALRGIGFEHIDGVLMRREQFEFILDECTFNGRTGYWWPALAAAATAAATAACINGGLSCCDCFSAVAASFKRFGDRSFSA